LRAFEAVVAAGNGPPRGRFTSGNLARIAVG
jgi:hypothetical protein